MWTRSIFCFCFCWLCWVPLWLHFCFCFCWLCWVHLWRIGQWYSWVASLSDPWTEVQLCQAHGVMTHAWTQNQDPHWFVPCSCLLLLLPLPVAMSLAQGRCCSWNYAKIIIQLWCWPKAGFVHALELVNGPAVDVFPQHHGSWPCCCCLFWDIISIVIMAEMLCHFPHVKGQILRNSPW